MLHFWALPFYPCCFYVSGFKCALWCPFPIFCWESCCCWPSLRSHAQCYTLRDRTSSFTKVDQVLSNWVTLSHFSSALSVPFPVRSYCHTKPPVILGYTLISPSLFSLMQFFFFFHQKRPLLAIFLVNSDIFQNLFLSSFFSVFFLRQSSDGSLRCRWLPGSQLDTGTWSGCLEGQMACCFSGGALLGY